MKFLAAAVQMLASDDKAANLKRQNIGFAKLRQTARGSLRCRKFSSGAARRNLKGNLLKRFPVRLRRRWPGWRVNWNLSPRGLDSRRDSRQRQSLQHQFAHRSHRQTHRELSQDTLFDVDLANGVSLRESDTRAHGDDVVVAQTELATMALSVCYDLRFPELYRGLADQAAQLILSLRRLRRLPALRTGKRCCARAPSRTKFTSLLPINSARALRVSKPTAIR